MISTPQNSGKCDFNKQKPWKNVILTLYLQNNQNFNTHKGAIFEHIIAESLVTQGYSLYFYRNEKSTIEMDFFVRDIDSLIPIEV